MSDVGTGLYHVNSRRNDGVIQGDLRIGNPLSHLAIDVNGTLKLLRTVYQPSEVASITAEGGITVTNTVMRIQGDGGAVTVTANPQIAAGVDGEFLIVEGKSDTNTITLVDGNGIHVHGSVTLFDEDYVIFVYDEGGALWDEIARSSPSSEKAVSFASPPGTTGTFWDLGYYDFFSGNNDFDPSANFGTANLARGAHVLFVNATVPGDEITIRVTGQSITDAGVDTLGDTEDVVIPASSDANSYFETSKKFNGEVAIETISGTPIQFNYGWCKYWDNANRDFMVVGVDIKWRGGANDSNADISLYHHKATGWTYNAGAEPTPPTALATMAADNAPNNRIGNGVPGAWKRTNLATNVNGQGSEGVVLGFTTAVNKSIESADGHVRIRTR